MTVNDDVFPTISISGGPHGRNVEMRKDGERLKGVTRFELTGDINDVLRLKTFQIVRAVVELQVEHTHAVTVNVFAMREEDRSGQIVVVGEEQIATAMADTVWNALYDCARQLELAAKKEAEQAER
jgi:hypothetical protein